MLRKYLIPVLFIVLVGFLTNSCSKYQKALKSNDPDYKYKMAKSYYEKEDYFRAYPLFEDLIPLFRGTQKAREVYYYYCYCNYYLGDYLIAAYHFKKYAKTYPGSEHSREVLFMSAYCYYLTSPEPSLDQTSTYKAISELQLYINTYPESDKVDSCNVLIDKLRFKLEKKAYDKASLYFKMENYKAAIVAYHNMLQDFPETDRYEEIHYRVLQSRCLLAVNSIREKKLKRIEDTIEAYYKFVDQFPKSEYIKDAEKIFNNIVEEKKEFQIQNS